MRFVFQSIMYRSLRDNRYDIEVNRFKEAIDSLAFKQTNSFPVGLFMKSLLSRSNLNKGNSTAGSFNGSIFDEFRLKGDQVDACLGQCVALWKKVFFITGILRQRESIKQELFTQFEAANTFLINKLRQLGKQDLAAQLAN